MGLDLSADVVTLTRTIVDVESVSRNEQHLADLVEAALRSLEHLEVTRIGNSVVARTDLGLGERVVIAGHLDTVPLNDNLPARDDGTLLHGLGTCDMKGGVAVALRLAHDVVPAQPRPDLRLLRVRGDRGDPQRPAPDRRRASRPGRGRLRDPDGAQRRRGRGRVPGHDPGRGARPRRGRTLRTVLARGQRRARGRRGAAPAQRLRGPAAGHRRPGVPRGPQRGPDLRRRGHQRAPALVPGHRQLPVRPRPLGRGGAGVPAGVLRRLRARGHRRGARRAARARRTCRQGLRRGRRR